MDTWRVSFFSVDVFKKQIITSKEKHALHTRLILSLLWQQKSLWCFLKKKKIQKAVTIKGIIQKQ